MYTELVHNSLGRVVVDFFKTDLSTNLHFSLDVPSYTYTCPRGHLITLINHIFIPNKTGGSYDRDHTRRSEWNHLMNLVHPITRTIDSLIVANAPAVNHRPTSNTFGSTSVLALFASHSRFLVSSALAR